MNLLLSDSMFKPLKLQAQGQLELIAFYIHALSMGGKFKFCA